MENSKTYYFRVADFNIRIVFKSSGEKKDGSYENGLHLIPSLIPFQIDRIGNDDPLFELVVDDDLRPRPKQEREPIKTFDTGNGDTIVDLLNDGGYQYIVKDIQKKDCCLLITNKNFDHCQCALNGNFNMRRFGINNALMLAFAFSSSRFQTVLMHASLVLSLIHICDQIRPSHRRVYMQSSYPSQSPSVQRLVHHNAVSNNR